MSPPCLGIEVMACFCFYHMQLSWSKVIMLSLHRARVATAWKLVEYCIAGRFMCYFGTCCGTLRLQWLQLLLLLFLSIVSVIQSVCLVRRSGDQNYLVWRRLALFTAQLIKIYGGLQQRLKALAASLRYTSNSISKRSRYRQSSLSSFEYTFVAVVNDPSEQCFLVVLSQGIPHKLEATVTSSIYHTPYLK